MGWPWLEVGIAVFKQGTLLVIRNNNLNSCIGITCKLQCMLALFTDISFAFVGLVDYLHLLRQRGETGRTEALHQVRRGCSVGARWACRWWDEAGHMANDLVAHLLNPIWKTLYNTSCILGYFRSVPKVWVDVFGDLSQELWGIDKS